MTADTEILTAPGRAARWRRAARANPILVIGSAFVALSLILMLIGPSITPYPPERATSHVSQPPPDIGEIPGLLLATVTGQLAEPVHWFGTDATGLDIFSRVIAAPRTDVMIALVANLGSLTAGTLLGLIAGFYRNRATELLMRVSDLVQSFPVLISGMILVALAGRTTGNIMLALGLLYTPIYLRLARAEVLTQRGRLYVEAARALGNREIVIALRHVLPNSLAPSLIQASVTIGFAILATAGLSFIGAGVRPPTPELGLMIATGADQMIEGDWWPSLFPGLAISLIVFGYAAFGNGLERLYGR
ncbi:MAG: ABC transporter permease [Pseudomonadota bacterium]